MAGENTDSQLDLSAGENPPGDEARKANALLDDARSRRRYRLFSFTLSVAVVGFFGWLLYGLACAVTAYVTQFSPWVVGIFASLVVAMAVITLALLKATFAPPEGAESKDRGGMPQVTLLADALRVLGDAVNALRTTIGK